MNAIEVRDVHKIYRRYGRRKQFATLKSALLSGGLLRDLRPEETFRPNRLWQLPLNGLHDYALPDTIAERLAPVGELATELASVPIELVVTVTDVSDGDIDERHAYERVYSSRTTPPYCDSP